MNEQTSTLVSSPASTVRVHGADRISEGAYWTGHITALLLLVVAIALILGGRGPRRRDALEATLTGPLASSQEGASAGLTSQGSQANGDAGNRT